MVGETVPWSQRHARALALLAGVALLWLPTAVFMTHNGLPLTSPVALAILAGSAVIGAVAGLLLASRLVALRVVTLAGLLVFVVDMQTSLLVKLDLTLMAVVVAALVVAWLLRNGIADKVAPIASVMVIATLLGPAKSIVTIERSEHADVPPLATLPPTVHLILDEHAGVEAIDPAFDPGNELAHAIQKAWVDAGFTVFGRAYSRWFFTYESMSHLYNNSRADETAHWYADRFSEGEPMLQNAALDELKRRGYRLHITHHTAEETCRTQQGLAADVCRRYDTESIGVLAGSELQLGRQVQLALGVMSRLSYVVAKLNLVAGRVWQRIAPKDASSEQEPLASVRVSPLTSMQMIDVVADDLRNLKPGQAHIIHLLLPHYPYAWRADCSLRTDGVWLEAFAQGGMETGVMNSPEERAERWPAYIEQLRCLQTKVMTLLDAIEQSGHFKDALILVHGDHGARIAQHFLYQNVADAITPRDLVDNLGAFFVFKPVGKARSDGHADRRILPIGRLYNAIMRDGAVPDGVDWAGPREVVLQAGQPWQPRPGQGKQLTTIPMTDFAWGLPVDATASAAP